MTRGEGANSGKGDKHEKRVENPRKGGKLDEGWQTQGMGDSGYGWLRVRVANSGKGDKHGVGVENSKRVGQTLGKGDRLGVKEASKRDEL